MAFDPSEPRVPAGGPDGGKWTSGGGGLAHAGGHADSVGSGPSIAPGALANASLGNDHAAHADAVHALHHSIISPNVLSIISNNPEGFSVSLAGAQPSNGYMVSTHGNTQIVEASALKGPGGQSVINDYVRTHADALSKPGAFIGGWTSKEGKVYLDVSERVADRDQAIHLGKARNQIAVWDVHNKVEILTGGTGH